ncbi:MAG: Rid family hydrolase [Halioglobus sp.]|nr:Rid family hydrolase [Halioglobus sp.]
MTLVAPPLHAHGIVRQQQAGLPVASSVSVPAGASWLIVGGTLAEVSNPGAPPGSAASLGDTAAQARSILARIKAELNSAGFAMDDIVNMEVYLVADPDKNGRVDALGLTSALLAYFGKDTEGLPTRSTVEVAGLPVPGALVQIAVTAARISHSESE